MWNITASHIGFAIIILFISVVISRSLILKNKGLQAVEFGGKDKKDFILVPFALLYLYTLAAHAFHLPYFSTEKIFYSSLLSWIGVFICILSLLFFIWTMISFQDSFRVGLAENSRQGLKTNGAFGISRNPIYVSFAFLLAGQFLIYPDWVLLLYFLSGLLVLHRQVLKEEDFLREQYGVAFDQYCKKVNRYL